MKIAVIADPLDNQNAGVHTYTKHLVESLISNKGKHQILIIREKKDTTLHGCSQIALWNTRLPIGYASLRLFAIVPYILMKEKVDVVIEPAHFGPFNLPKSIKRVTMIHDLTPLIFPQFHKWHSQLLQRLFLPGILRRADLILSNSKNTSKDLEMTFPGIAPKIHTILLGKDKAFQPTGESGQLNTYGIRRPYFHFVGTIEPRKDLMTLLTAYEKFRNSSDIEPAPQLVIAGGIGWKSQPFLDALRNHPYKEDILLTGFVPKSVLPELHSHSIALIYPSLYEGFGLPVLEAMSCGCDVITCRNSSLTEVGGALAYYFETSNPVDLSIQMNEVVSTELSIEHKTQLIQWSNHFDWNDYAINLIQILETM